MVSLRCYRICGILCVHNHRQFGAIVRSGAGVPSALRDVSTTSRCPAFACLADNRQDDRDRHAACSRMDVPSRRSLRGQRAVNVTRSCSSRSGRGSIAVTKVENWVRATSLTHRHTLRSVIAQAELDELLSEARQDQHEAAGHHRHGNGAWGIKVTAVEVRDVTLRNR